LQQLLRRTLVLKNKYNNQNLIIFLLQYQMLHSASTAQ